MRSVRLFAAALVLLGGPAVSAPPASSANGTARVTQSGVRAPLAIYERTCGYCHAANVGPIILGRNLPPQTVVYFVRHGSGAMPAFKPTEISEAELAALARWISEAPPVAQEKGQ